MARLRDALGLAPQPTTAVVTGSGEIDLRHPGLGAPDVPVLIATTNDGAGRLVARGLPPHVRALPLAPEAPIPAVRSSRPWLTSGIASSCAKAGRTSSARSRASDCSMSCS